MAIRKCALVFLINTYFTVEEFVAYEWNSRYFFALNYKNLKQCDLFIFT